MGGGAAGGTLPRPGQVTLLPDEEQDTSPDAPLIAPLGTQDQRQGQLQMQVSSGNQVMVAFAWGVPFPGHRSEEFHGGCGVELRAWGRGCRGLMPPHAARAS